MSRAQEQAVADTASGQNKTFNTNAQNAFTGADTSLTTQQGDVNQYQDQLSKFAAANPYGAGGAFQTATNTATAGTADAGAQAAAQAAQAAAVRTGQNASGGVAEGVKASQQGTRDLMTEQAKLNADRITQGAGYGAKVLQASEVPATLQGAITGERGKLASTEADAGNQALGVDQKASEDPSFWDTFGEAAGSSAGKAAGTMAAGAVGGLLLCWVAAELYGGWMEPRAVLVRTYLRDVLHKKWYGWPLVELYVLVGEKTAAAIRKFPFLRRIFLPIFNLALAKARKESNGR